MGIVDEIRKAVNFGRQVGSTIEKGTLRTFAKGANDATIQFPCLMSKSIEIERANSLLRLLDRTYAGFVQTYFSMNSTIDISIDPTPAHYLRRYHQNMSLESTEDEDVMEESGPTTYVTSDGKYAVVFEGTTKGVRELLKDNRYQMREFLSEYDLRPFPGDAITYMEASPKDPLPQADERTKQLIMMAAMNKKTNADAEIGIKLDNLDVQRGTLNQKISLGQSAPKMTDMDVKKSNDILPYGVEVKLMAINSNQEFVNYMTFIVGVKAVLHPIDSDDMMENIMKTMANSSKVFNFIRWTTGEISFVKDYLLNIKNIRDDARGRANVSPYFSALRRAKNKGYNTSHLGVKKMIPNATVVITDFECQAMKKAGYDLTKPKIAKLLIDRLFLMTFIILDEATRTVSILYDGSDAFQVYSIESLDRDMAMASSKLSKEIGKMISY